ncbi:hypothetical protein BH10ACT7_BH10ACT7_33150 [soil metagenome]
MKLPELGSTRDRLVALLWLGPIGILFAAALVLLANIVRDVPAVTAFIEQYPGKSALPEGAPVGFPVWLQVQHFLNSFFLVLIVRTGWQIRTAGRPPMRWQRTNTGFIRTANPPTKMSIYAWFHLSLDVFWVVNGMVFLMLIFTTGQWMRIVPVSWDVFPHALSVAIQYASLEWPTENSWVNYNALQLLTYFATVFIAAPLAIITGIRMSPAWSIRFRRFDRLFPLKAAKAIHFPVMLYFVGFTIVHVALVLATGALRNLNHMYGVGDVENWVGFAIFAASIVVMIAAWLLARPSVLKPIASLTGTVSR